MEHSGGRNGRLRPPSTSTPKVLISEVSVYIRASYYGFGNSANHIKSRASSSVLATSPTWHQQIRNSANSYPRTYARLITFTTMSITIAVFWGVICYSRVRSTKSPSFCVSAFSTSLTNLLLQSHDSVTT